MLLGKGAMAALEPVLQKLMQPVLPWIKQLTAAAADSADRIKRIEEAAARIEYAVQETQQLLYRVFPEEATRHEMYIGEMERIGYAGSTELASGSSVAGGSSGKRGEFADATERLAESV